MSASFNEGKSLTIEAVRDAAQKYLSGEWDFDEINDWCDSVTQRGDDVESVRMASQISLMTCEVTLSGQLRTEQEFRDDVVSLMVGRDLTAFYPFLDKRLADYESAIGRKR